MKKALKVITLLLPISVIGADAPNHFEPADLLPQCETKFTRLLGTIQDVRRGKTTQYVECVEPVPVLEVSTVNTVGDRFRPVEFYVDYTLRGKQTNYKVEATLGNVTVNGQRVTIHGDGNIGIGTVVIAEEEYQYEIVEEPTCKRSSNYDCNGYYSRGRQDYIHYGEEDENVVVWEIVWVENHNYQEWYDNAYDELYPNGMPITDERTNKRIDDYIRKSNELMRRSGVFVELKVVDAFEYPYRVTGEDPLYSLRDLRNDRGFGRRKGDFLVGNGASRSGTCGVAFVSTSYTSGWPLVSVGRCGWQTFLHEIGHNAGLAHGPENSDNAQSGYIYPWFGHGRENLCNTYDTIMSYGTQEQMFSNSKLTCGDVVDAELSRYWVDQPAGARDVTDEAYVLNMVRYSISLIHDEHSDKKNF